MRPGRRAALGALVAGVFAVRAGATPAKRLAVVHFGPVSDWEAWLGPFRSELAKQGFATGRSLDLLLEPLAGENRGQGPQPLAEALAARLAVLRPDVVVTDGPITTLILHLATRTIPVVTQVPDPVGAGYAQSLRRPGGNITGLADGVEEIAVKTMELVRQLVPKAGRIAIFGDPRPASLRYLANFERAARDASIEPVPVLAKESAELYAGLRDLPSRRIPAGLWAWVADHPRKAAEQALAARIALFTPDASLVRFGYLAAYGAHEPAPQVRLAAIAAQVLRGAKPGEIPFEFPQQFRLAVNRRTANALGIAIPPEVLLRADEVIE